VTLFLGVEASVGARISSFCTHVRQSTFEPGRGRPSVYSLQIEFAILEKRAEWQTSLEMSEKCPLCHLKMSVPQGKFAIQPKKPVPTM
jgi:hypothetical protein